MSINNDINDAIANDNNALKVAYNLVKNTVNLTLTQYKRRFYTLNGENVRFLNANDLNEFNAYLLISENEKQADKQFIENIF